MHHHPQSNKSTSTSVRFIIGSLVALTIIFFGGLMFCMSQKIALNREITDLSKEKSLLKLKLFSSSALLSLANSKNELPNNGQENYHVVDRDHEQPNNDEKTKDNKLISSSSNVPRAISKMRYRVVVFTYLRPEGLKRLLKSLKAAYYPPQSAGTTVSLNILLDYPKTPKRPLSESAAAAQHQDREETLRLIDSFQWKHGPFVVHRRQGNVGLKRNILESWYPSSQAFNDNKEEVSILLEDDIEVSPFWFDWATASVEKYFFQAREKHPELHEKILGVSLYRPIHDEQSHRKCTVNNNHQPYLLQQPCSWGAIFFPGPWKNFRDWYDEFTSSNNNDPQSSQNNEEPLVRTEKGEEPDANTWAKSSSWKKYLIRHMYEQGWAMVYPNLPDNLVFSTNHLMKGEHPTPKRSLFELPLLDAEHAKSIWPEKKDVVEEMVAVIESSNTDNGEGAKEKSTVLSILLDESSSEEQQQQLPDLLKLKSFDVMFNEENGGAVELMKPKKNLANNHQKMNSNNNKHSSQHAHHHHQQNKNKRRES